ncbi:MAG TPA: hypothetical protein VFJ76_02050 [Solirubrobacterales bacterium]|nr:hypothetical protein [Solirubrobacterales bacterium]
MKPTKVLLILAMVALTVMAAATAASASEWKTVLCKTQHAVCPTEEVLKAGSGGGLYPAEIKITSAFSGATQLGCTGKNGPIGGDLFASTAESGAPLPAITQLYLQAGGCEQLMGNSCVSSTSINSPSATIEQPLAEGARMTIGSATAPLKINAACETIFGPMECKWAATEGVVFNINQTTLAVTSSPMSVKLQSGSNTGFCGTGEGILYYKGTYKAPPISLI